MRMGKFMRNPAMPFMVVFAVTGVLMLITVGGIYAGIGILIGILVTVLAWKRG